MEGGVGEGGAEEGGRGQGREGKGKWSRQGEMEEEGLGEAGWMEWPTFSNYSTHDHSIVLYM